MKKVKDEFPIDEDWLYDKASSETRSEYWQSCLDFFNDVKDQVANSISDKQRDWLTNILIKCEEETS